MPNVSIASSTEDKPNRTSAYKRSMQMPLKFHEKLGSVNSPEEAAEIESLIVGKGDFSELPESRKMALKYAVQYIYKRLVPEQPKKEVAQIVAKASTLDAGVSKNCARKSELIGAYRELIKSGDLPKSKLMDAALTKKGGKSHSGVLVITVFMGPGPFSCPKDCHYCPNQPGIARSYLLREPGVLRGYRNGWDPIRQFNDRALALENNGHVVDKIELIILGGTFSFYPKDYVEEFITASFYAANTYFDAPPYRPMGSLSSEIHANETAECRIIGITAETRPDYINKTELRRFRILGITRVQLGIQHLDDEILNKVNRDCPTYKAAMAIKLLLDCGFKVDAHWMPDLPGSSFDKDMSLFEFLLSSSNTKFQVDQWKVYPTMTTPFTQIKKWHEEGTYKPYAEEDGGSKMVELMLFILRHSPYKLRLNRIVRDIPNNYILGGENRPNLRQLLASKMQERGILCKDIRERECKGQCLNIDDATLFVDTFATDGGTEYYCSVENSARTVLYGHLRLRLRDNIQDSTDPSMFLYPSLAGAALIRELHTYGKIVAVRGGDTEKVTQHHGVGKQLMKRAEEIAVSQGYKRIAVISGVGVRGYYEKLNYKLEDTYMVKELSTKDKHTAPFSKFQRLAEFFNPFAN